MENYPTARVVPREVMVFVTPEDLRHIADLAERKWEKDKDTPGSDLIAFTIIGQDVNISFVIAQERVKAGEL